MKARVVAGALARVLLGGAALQRCDKEFAEKRLQPLR